MLFNVMPVMGRAQSVMAVMDDKVTSYLRGSTTDSRNDDATRKLQKMGTKIKETGGTKGDFTFCPSNTGKAEATKERYRLQ